MLLRAISVMALCLFVGSSTEGYGGMNNRDNGTQKQVSTERKQRVSLRSVRTKEPKELRRRERLLEKQEKRQLPKAYERLLRRKTGNIVQTSSHRRNRAWNGVQKTPAAARYMHSTSTSDSVRPLWVSHFASGLSPSVDAATAMTVDAAGNIYVAGYSTGMFSGEDFITIKYNTHGQQLWVARYNGPGNDYDEATAIAVDGNGNVYVTGSSFGIDTEEDFATIKYNSNGVEQWVARYNGSGDDYDSPVGITVDGGGNVHVAGVSYGITSDADIAVVKYNSLGIQQWARRFDGPASDSDIPEAMGMDPSGSIYVAGTSYRHDTYEDYVIVKYSYVGDQAWVVYHDGTGNDYDVITAMVVDNSGNTYVTGISYNAEFDSDYFTIKYTTFGNRLWTSRYAGADGAEDIAAAIALDPSRQVYVTGTSWGTTSDDFTTVKYGTTGATRWVRQYNGPANLDDEATAITVDASENVYVTGLSYGVSSYEDYATVKYNTNGVQIWVARYSGPALDYDAPSAIALDGSGNVFVAGTSYGDVTDEDILTVKYNVNGIQQWDVRYNGPGNSEDEAVAMAIDPSGNVYVTGTSYDFLTQTDYATVKYNQAGVQQWIARYDGPGKGDDFANAIAVDAFGSVYVTGTSYNDTSGYDIATIKYNSLGIRLWATRYAGIANYVEEGLAIALDAAGNVYVAGARFNPGTGFDFITLKYNTLGQQQWVSFYNGPADTLDHAESIAVDGIGNIYVTGPSYSISGGLDYATVKYNTNGVQQWVARHNGADNGPDVPTMLALDNAGNVIVTGASFRTSTLMDYATIKYSPAGVTLWTRYFTGPGANNDVASAVKADALGNVYVTGTSVGTGTSLDFATVKYSSAGVEQWVARYNNPENDDDAATAMALDQNGNIYVSGFSFMFESGYDFATVKYDPSGAEKWVSRFDNPGMFSDEPTAIAVDQFGNVIVSGISETDEGSVYTTVKYEAPLISLSTASMTFGSVDVGCRTVDTLVVRNNAQVNALVVSHTYTSNQSFTVSPGSFLVAAGDSVKVVIRFAPLSAGSKTGSIVLIHNGIVSPDSVLVSGTGIGSGSAVLFSTHLGNGWRLFSLPVAVTCPFVVPFSYGFNNQYFRSDTIFNRRAYWTKLSDPIMHTMGYPIISDSFPVQTGWNLIGTISLPFLTATVSTTPESLLITSFFGYAGTYAMADTVVPGFGYWVKARTNGMMYVGGSMARGTNVALPVIPTTATALNFTNDLSHLQSLFVMSESGDRPFQRECFELPPLPPEGGFDVRFSTQRMVEVIEGATVREIEHSSPVYPVIVEWRGHGEMHDIALAVDGTPYSLGIDGSAVIPSVSSAVKIVSGAATETPVQFGLEQNYPNPFNPETHIRYTIADAGRVRLEVFNMLGQSVRVLVNEVKDAGYHAVTWDGLGNAGAPVGSGIYIYKLTAVSSSVPGNVSSDTRKMILLK